MAELNKIYKCEICGNIVEVVNAGGGTLFCCGKAMTKLDGNSTDGAFEKHVPVVEVLADKTVSVKVGSVEHPMTDAHYIQWIEILTDNNKVYRKHLTPTDKPEAKFNVDGEIVAAREYCNIHGLWTTK